MAYDNPQSTAKIAGHPIHPMLVVFPIAFWIAALVCDIVYLGDGAAGWAVAAMWLVGAGAVMAIIAALAGFADFFGDSRVRRIRHAWNHMIGNAIALVLSLLSLSLRVSEGAAEAVAPWGVALSAIVVIMIGYTGWLGGELVYRHRVGVSDADAPRRPRERTREEVTHRLH